MVDLPAGRADASTQLYELYRQEYRSLVRLAVVLVDDRHLAEEVVQEAFVRTHLALGRLRDDDRLAAYVRSAVLNGARSALRRRATGRRIGAEPPAHRPVEMSSPDTSRAGGPSGSSDSAGRSPSPEAEAVARQTRRDVLQAVRDLPERQRECVLLRYFLDLSEAETAATLGVSPGTVKTSCHRALATLATRLEALR